MMNNGKDRPAETLIRVIAVKDRSSNRYFLEIYHPAEAQQAFVTTEPRYVSTEAALNDMIALLAAGANNPRTLS
jgi:hypothetical protein